MRADAAVPGRAPRVSVLVAVYNMEPHLRECLDSLARQRRDDIEFVLVDDASADGSWDICREYAARDPRFRVERHERNRGTVVSRRDGILAARGDWLMFLDHDDYLNGDDAVDRALALAESGAAEVTQFVTAPFADGPGHEAQMRHMTAHLRAHVGLTGDRVARGRVAILRAATRRGGGANILLWNKIWPGPALRAAAAYIGEDYMYLGEDLYLFFLFACHVRSLAGAETPPLVSHRLGTGISSTCPTLDKFRTKLLLLPLINRLSRFLDRIGAEAGCRETLRRVANHNFDVLFRDLRSLTGDAAEWREAVAAFAAVTRREDLLPEYRRAWRKMFLKHLRQGRWGRVIALWRLRRRMAALSTDPPPSP